MVDGHENEKYSPAYTVVLALLGVHAGWVVVVLVCCAFWLAVLSYVVLLF